MGDMFNVMSGGGDLDDTHANPPPAVGITHGAGAAEQGYEEFQ